MPFTALVKALHKISKNSASLSEAEQRVVVGLKNKTYSPAEAAHLLLPTIGTESRATLAIAYFAIIQNNETSVSHIVKEKQLLFRLAFPPEDHDVDRLPKVTQVTVKEEINLLLQVGLLERMPSGRIILGKK